MKERSKMPLLLTELSLMLLIFSLCAAICLSVFAASRKTARESGALGNAAAWAQSAAEAYRAAKGDVAEAAELIGAEVTQDGFACYFDESWAQASESGADYALILSETGENAANIAVTDDAETLFSLNVKAVAYG
ncbi:MAG: hypothetical protein EOM54_01560 [Clostridia bacterium]|nr:hypothetical protein [Clostridia bacterium]